MLVFNIASALSHLRNKLQIRNPYDGARIPMIDLIRGARSPSREESDLLRQYFNQADRYLGIQSTAMLLRAIELVERMTAQGDPIR